MNNVLKISSKKTVVFLVICLLFISFPISFLQTNMIIAEEQHIETKEGYGSILNSDGARDYERAMINKSVSFGNKPGEYFIDLHVKGKEKTEQTTTDIVLVYDNSNSMESRNRVGIAKAATTNFVQQILHADNALFQFSLVTYGSAVFDGRERNWPTRNATTYEHGPTNDYSFKTFTKNPTDITDKLPGNVPSNRGKTWDGGTFTQQGLEEASKVLAQSTATNKVVVLITDGVTTFSYADDRKSVVGDGSSYEAAHGNRTIAESKALQNKGYDVFTVGVELAAEQGITKGEAEQLVQQIASSTDKSYVIDDVAKLETSLQNIGKELVDTVVDGKIIDPVREQFIIQENDSFTMASDETLSDGHYYVTATNEHILQDVSVFVDNDQVMVDGLNLGANDEINIRYKIQIDTELEHMIPNVLYETNGEAVLIPIVETSEAYTFPEPKASAVSTSVIGEKKWQDFGYEVYRPDEIMVELLRTSDGENIVVDETEVTANKEGKWTFSFEDLFLYDRTGETIDYTVHEKDVVHYTMDVDGTTIVNMLDQQASIELTKVGKGSLENDDKVEVGEKINYIFTIKNNGNIPLGNIHLTDDMVGLSDIQYETVNDEVFAGKISDVILEPGDQLVATATYEVTENDLKENVIHNVAIVEGTPTVPTPGPDFDDTPIQDEDVFDIEVIEGESKKDDAIVNEVEQVRNGDDETPKTDEQLNEEGTTVEVVKVGEETGANNTLEEQAKKGLHLPNTATNMYTIMLIGALLAIIGIGFFIWRRKVNRQV